jgi:hypothetical protein
MVHLLFLLVRILTGVTVSGALVIVLLIVFLHSAANFAKEGVGVIGYVAALFTSGFTKGVPPPEARGWMVNVPQIGLAILFTSMLASLFLPGARTLLHVVAAMGAVTLIWYARMIFNGPQLEVLCLPLFPIWYVYYGLCLNGSYK